MFQSDRETKRAAWAERIAEFQASGQRAPQWCAARELKLHQFRYWLKKLQRPVPAEPSVRWLPVGLSDPESTLTVKVGVAAIEVKSGFDPQLLTTVVKTLSAL